MNIEEQPGSMATRALLGRMACLAGVSLGLGLLGRAAGLEARQCVAGGVFVAIILGTLFFWGFRLAIAFIGLAVLIGAKALDIPHFVEASALPVIMFLVGMMIVVGALRDLGFFTWVIQALISIPRVTGRKFILAVGLASALLACAVDEVTSMLFVATLIFHVCNRLKVKPSPFIIISVLCTNVGSAGTMMGNPVGIYIGTQAGLTFEDFLLWSFPVMLAALAATIAVVMLWYRREIAAFDEALRERLARHLALVPQVQVPYRRGLVVFALTMMFIASHNQIETRLGLDRNSVLLMAPLVCASLIMIVRRDRARHYVEQDVDWWTLVFFMVLFAVAGTLEYSGLTRLAAKSFARHLGTSHGVMVPVVLFSSALGSALVDNVVFVAAYAPVIREMGEAMVVTPLWWALLFGACFGGNITLIGSTANIVALGMLEKHARAQIRFMDWLKIGGICALAACLIAWLSLMILAPFMEVAPR